MDTAIVELNTLADTVGAAAQNHDLLLVVSCGALILNMIAGVVVSGILGTADVYAFPAFHNAVGGALAADILFRNIQNLAQVLIGETVQLGLTEHFYFGQLAGVGLEGLFLFHQFLHLLNEVVLHLGALEDFVHSSTLAQCFIHDEVTLTAGSCQHLQQFLLGKLAEVLHAAQTITAIFQAADCLLECLFVGLANAHDFAHSTHLGSQLVLNALKLLESPSCELDHHIVAAGHILIQCAVLAAGDFVQSQAAGQHGGNQRDGETGSLGGQSGRTGGTGIDLDNDNTAADRIVSKLHVGTADHFDSFHDLISLTLQFLLHVFGNGEHGGRAEGVTGVNSQRIDVLDEADGDHVVLGIADHFQLQLFPAENGLFHQNLTHQTGLQTAGTDGFQLVHIVHQTAAGAAHGVSRTENDRVAQLISDGQCLVHTVSHLTAGHFNAQGFHGLLELDTVFAALNSINLNADNFHIVLIQYACILQFGAQVQTRLAAQIWKQRIRSLLGDNLFQAVHIQGLDIGDIGRVRVSHNGCRVGVYQNDLIAEISQRLAGLCAGVVKLARLTDDDRTGTNNQYLVNIFSLHNSPMPFRYFFFNPSNG